VPHEVIAIATSAMYTARGNGGNQPRYVLAPPLTVLNHTDGADGYHA
jgi:hypothetical protein